MSQEKRYKSGLSLVAQILSDLFCPLLVPTYGIALALWGTSLRALPERSRWLATLVIAIITGLVPLVVIAVLRQTGRVSDNSMSNREQRPLPMAITMLCYVAAGLFLGSARAPLWLRVFFYGAALATAIDTVITFRWKISAHTTAMGGLTGLILWLAVAGMADVSAMAILSIGIVLAGTIATSRLILGRHTLAQVMAGLLLGFACTFGLTYLSYFS